MKPAQKEREGAHGVSAISQPSQRATQDLEAGNQLDKEGTPKSTPKASISEAKGPVLAGNQDPRVSLNHVVSDL